MALKEVKHYKSKSLPSPPVPDAILYIKADGDTEVTTYITDLNGVPYLLKDDQGSTGIQTITNNDGTISVLGGENKVLNLSSSIKAVINSALQPGNNISELLNDAGYLTNIDVLPYELLSNKQDSLEIDGTGNKYPTVDAINAEVEVINSNLNQKLNIVDYNEYFQGKYSSLSALQTAKPTGKDGDYAIVDIGAGEDAKTYLWDSEDGWVEGGSSGAATTDALPEGSTNLYFQAARVLATVLNGISFAVGTPVTSADNILVAFGKVQKQISDLITAVGNIFQPNQLISSVPPTRSVNTFTYPATQYQALINKTIRTNPAQFITTITVASTPDHKRVDLIWFKDDNTLIKVVGTESLTVAPRPDIPIGVVGVPVSFINVFGNVISDPTPITTEISIQDYSGIEQFKITDFIRFKGFSFDAVAKALVTDPLVPLSAFLDITNGNDITAVLENANKPFKTMAKLIETLPVASGETYTIYITGGNIPITKRMPNRNLKFVAYTNTNLDFTLCKENDGVTEASVVISNAGSSTWTFENSNISLICDYVGSKAFYFSTANAPILKGNINNLNWKSAVLNGSVCIANNSNIIFNNVYDSPQNTSIFNNQTNNYDVIIKNLMIQYGRIVNNKSRITIENIIKVGTSTFTLQICNNNSGVEVTNIGNVNLEGCTLVPHGNKVNFNGTISPTCTVNINALSLITGTVSSTTYLTNNYLSNTQVFNNFNGKLANLLVVNSGKASFYNCIIETEDTLIQKYTQGTSRDDLAIFKGVNVVTQKTLNGTFDIFRNNNNSNTGKIIVEIDGSLITNASSYGKLVEAIYLSNTFKEKRREQVIRDKKDLVNRVLSSNIKYIIDGAIILITNEYIQVPSGGLDIGGYGFDTSSISKNVSGQSIFISPAGNSGNFVSKDISYYPGIGSVFNIIDSTGGHAIELNDVNFQGVAGSSLGSLNSYRQFTGTTCGFYNLSDGFILEGNWSGFKLTNSNVINFGSSGILFKKGIATIFSNRFCIDLNLQIDTESIICDFAPANFTNDKSLQVVNCYVKVNGIIDDATTSATFPNITPYDSKSYFVNNIGIKNSNNMPYGISTVNMQTYADDAAASAGGIVQIGEMYIESSTGYFKKRLT